MMYKRHSLKFGLVISTILASGVLIPSISQARSRTNLPSIEINFEVLQQLREQEVAKASIKEKAPTPKENVEVAAKREPVKQKTVSKLDLNPFHKLKKKTDDEFSVKPVNKPKFERNIAKAEPVEKIELPPKRLPQEDKVATKPEKTEAKLTAQKKEEANTSDKLPEKQIADNKESESVFMELPRKLPEAASNEAEPLVKQEPTNELINNAPPAEQNNNKTDYKEKVLSFFDKIPSVTSLFGSDKGTQNSDENKNVLPPVEIKDLEEIAENNIKAEKEEAQDLEDTEEYTSEIATKNEEKKIPDYISAMGDNVQIILPNKLEENTIGFTPTPKFRPINKDNVNLDIIANLPTPVDIVDANIEYDRPVVAVDTKESAKNEIKIEPQEQQKEKAAEVNEIKPVEIATVEPKIPDPLQPVSEIVNLARPDIEPISDEKWQQELESVRKKALSVADTPEIPKSKITDNNESNAIDNNIAQADISIADVNNEETKDEKSLIVSLKEWMPSFGSKKEEDPVITLVDIPHPLEIKAPQKIDEPLYLNDVAEEIKKSEASSNLAEADNLKVEVAEDKINEPVNKGLAEFELTSLPQEQVISEEVITPKKLNNGSAPLLNIVFKGNETNIADFDKDRLSDFVQKILPGGKMVKIVSYAPKNSDENNLSRRISLKRAISIRAAMIDAGLESLRINVQAMGEEEGKSNSVNIFVLEDS